MNKFIIIIVCIFILQMVFQPTLSIDEDDKMIIANITHPSVPIMDHTVAVNMSKTVRRRRRRECNTFSGYTLCSDP
ncbi:hypothetical protein I4U23_010399 [Adineta vaga]|nr:hypothetical protein I4U23_010399 [Adineta vaga]